MTPRRRLLSLVAATGLVLAGCGSEAPDEVAESTAPRTETTAVSRSADAGGSPTSASGATSELLTFKAPAIGGGQVDAAAFQGTPTLLWFWAPW